MKFILPLLAVFTYNFTFAQSSQAVDDYDSQIGYYLDQSKSLRRAAWITLGGGYLATGVALALAPTAKAQDHILFAASAVPITTFILHFRSTHFKNTAKLIEIERDLSMSHSHYEKQVIMNEATRYFKQKAVNNRTPAIILSTVGGVIVVGGLASSIKTQDPYAPIAIAGGLSYIGASVPFYIRAAKHEKTRRLLSEGILPTRDFRKESVTLSMLLAPTGAGIRITL